MRASTLRVRHVPAEVRERLSRLARREQMSLSAFVLRELTELARRADNAELLADLPHHGISAEEVLSELNTGRGYRLG